MQPGPVPAQQLLLLVRAQMEQRRVDPLQPRRPVGHHVVVEPDLRADLQHLWRRHPRFRYPALLEQLAQSTGVELVGLGPALVPTDPIRRLRRIRDMYPNPGRLTLLGDEPPAGAALDHQIHLPTSELDQPVTKARPRRRRQPAPPRLTRHHVHPVESDLSAMNVAATYDPHRDLLEHHPEQPACHSRTDFAPVAEGVPSHAIFRASTARVEQQDHE